MPGPLRSLFRLVGRDIVRYPRIPGGERSLLTILDKSGVNLIFDVGANVGQYASRMRRLGYDGRIVSFEPVAAAHAELTKAASGDDGWVVAPRTALGDEDGVISMQVSNRSDMSSALTIRAETLTAQPKAQTIGVEEAPVARLDRLYPEHIAAGEFAFLKMDTQGFERRILEGARESLGKLAGLQLEMSLRPLYDGESDYLELIEVLAARGFEPVLFLPGFFSKRLGRQLQIDAVFLRSDSLDR